MVAQHIANGMYGMIVVEPKEGLPKSTRSCTRWKATLPAGTAAMKAARLRPEQDARRAPDYVLFNGSVGANTGRQCLPGQCWRRCASSSVGGPN
jgi:nitrite reductase (NO-forming)